MVLVIECVFACNKALQEMIWNTVLEVVPAQHQDFDLRMTPPSSFDPQQPSICIALGDFVERGVQEIDMLANMKVGVIRPGMYKVSKLSITAQSSGSWLGNTSS